MSTAISKAGSLVLSGGALADAPVTSEGKDAAGVPYKVFRKDLIRVGEWNDGKKKFSVTDANLSHWREMSLAMERNGVKIPIPAGHTNDPDKTRGYAENFTIEDGVLYADMRMIGADAILAASRNEVSICVPEYLVDGKGNRYETPIQHIALTPEPVISGQGPFVPVSLARAGGGFDIKQFPLLRLERTQAMDLKALATRFGIATDGLDDAGLETAINAKADAFVASTKAATEAATSLSLANERIKTLELSRGKPIDVDADTLDMAAEAVESKLEAMELSCKINPAVRKELSALLCGKEGERPAQMLSRKAAVAAGFPSALATAVLSILDKNDIRKPGTLTGPQVKTYSRETPGGEGGAMTAEQTSAAVKELAKLAPAR